MQYTFQITRSSKNPNKWRKSPFAIIEAGSAKEAWEKFCYDFGRGVPDGRWVRCLDENGKTVLNE
jgi:hypothetical protein